MTGVLGTRADRLRRLTDDLAGAADPDPELIHQIRVAARRLQAALSVFRPLADLPPAVRVSRIRRVERRLGGLRDLDVLAGSLLPGELPSLSAEAGADLTRLRQVLLQERDPALRRARRAVTRTGYERALRALRTWLDAPEFSPAAMHPATEVAPDLVFPSFARVLLDRAWWTETIPAPDDPAAKVLHRLRRRIKALRYRAECLSGCYGDSLTSWLQRLHAIQNGLGQYHDGAVLLGRLGEGSG
ncbi:MAG TPA: CHAD domain-containing protein, partial [Gemmatimonadales bacterium]|nr:CHAD domain-containing protein [Gemmatimonadales bacterium]